jgi:hypothetical protein
MSKISELEQHLAGTLSPVEKVDTLNALAEALDDIDLERSMDLFQQAADLAYDSGYREGLAWALAGQAKVAGDLNQYDEMSRLGFQTLEELKGFPPHQAEAYAQIQLSWNYLARFRKAFKEGETSLQIKEWNVGGIKAR